MNEQTLHRDMHKVNEDVIGSGDLKDEVITTIIMPAYAMSDGCLEDLRIITIQVNTDQYGLTAVNTCRFLRTS